MKRKLTFVYDYIFPNFILPNALNTQLGIINYISSMHTNRTFNHTIFESPANPENKQIFMSDLFDQSLGHNPNTSHGYFFQANVYRPYLEYEETSVLSQIPTHRYRKFIYPIRPNPIITQFSGMNNILHDKLNGEYFWKFISREVLETIKMGNGIIYIDYTMEPFVDYTMHKALNNCLKNSGIPKESIILCINSFNAKELYESWFRPDEQRYRVINLPFSIDNSSYHYNSNIEKNTPVSMTELEFLNSKNTIRPNKYLMKIRNNRTHRVAILYNLTNDDLLKYGDWSFLTNSNFNKFDVENIISQYKLKNIDLNKIEQLYKQIPHLLQSESNNDYNKTNAWTDLDCIPHLNSYFEILFETLIDGNHKSFTEKVFKPIANFQPFLLVTFRGGLKLLKELGFKTFDGFIDESYDEIEDTSLRLEKIYEEIKKLCHMSNEELHNWYWSMEDILLHNQKLLLNYHKTKLYGLEFINELYNIQNNIKR